MFTAPPARLQLCSPALADSLNILKKKKRQYLMKRRRTARSKALRAVRGAQTVGKVWKTTPKLEHGASDVSQIRTSFFM